VGDSPSTGQILKSLRPSLEALKLVRRRDTFYTIDTAPGFAGCVAFGSTVGGYARGVRGIWPVIGVRHDPTERLLAQFAGQRAPIMQTIGVGLGYLTPSNRFREWELSTSKQYDDARSDLVDAIEEWGLPFFRSHVTLESILDALDARLAGDIEFKRPVVLLQLDRVDEAVAAVDELLSLLPREPSSYNDHVQEWVARFRAAI
jgi:hypothetical protein